ncbi:hypothetical protein NDU88_004072 [Pleurodeles waltl]|uniref:Uncharacterized protein n=1 Tax=Pleurodeles waltl TaxID=8319 RepID=A0AAV7UEB3_PLEWA|nr:hypothetical protein NDU88_004072 [Pleurodeles waltl]
MTGTSNVRPYHIPQLFKKGSISQLTPVAMERPESSTSAHDARAQTPLGSPGHSVLSPSATFPQPPQYRLDQILTVIETSRKSMETALGSLTDDHRKLKEHVAVGKGNIAALQPQALDNSQAITNLQEKFCLLENYMDDAEGRSCRSTIHIFGLPEGVQGTDPLLLGKSLQGTDPCWQSSFTIDWDTILQAAWLKGPLMLENI